MRKRNTIVKEWPGVIDLETEAALLFSDSQKNLTTAEDGEFAFKAAALIQSSDVDTGETQEILSIQDQNNEVWVTISPTFIDDFVTISDWLSNRSAHMTSFILGRGMSKRGRGFLKCDMGTYVKEEINA